ncbi:MAG: thiol reductant ABC exporter subunit CydD [Alphaproteobacteria bacterium]|nr:thiol reductant ABC exporter subunit CydD [Alphaproteobacteria bacterium]
MSNLPTLRTLSAPSAAGRLAMALPVVSGLLLIPQAWLLAKALQDIVVGQLSTGALMWSLAGLGTLMLVRVALGFGADIVAIAAAERSKASLRGSLLGTVFNRAPIWTASRSSGALSGAMVDQVEALDGYLTRYMPAMAQAALVPAAIALAVLPVDWVVTTLFLISAPLIPVFMALVGWGAEAANRQQAASQSALGGYFADRLRGLVTLKLFGRADAETEQAGRASEDLRKRTMGVMRIAFLSSAVLEFFAALGVAGVALYVGLSYLGLVNLRFEPFSLQAGLFCLLMAPEVYQPLRLLAAHYHDRAAAKAAVAEIAAQFEAGGPVDDATVVAVDKADKLEADLVLSDVSVDAPDGRAVVSGVSFTLRPGEHIAIVGSSGSGKSTLLEALAGLRPYRGNISLGGRELDDIAAAQLRQAIGMVGQRPLIFAGSIADNVLLGDRSASPASLQVACAKAQVNAFADLLPGRLETELGETGLGLSGGERQRVALARLYLRSPGLVLLDEPTAHLDSQTEQDVLDALMAFGRGRTMIVVTHADAVAARMDRCFRLVDGQLLAMPVPKLPPAGRRSAA